VTAEYAKLSKSHRAPPVKLEESSRNRAFTLTIQGATEKIKASTIDGIDTPVRLIVVGDIFRRLTPTGLDPDQVEPVNIATLSNYQGSRDRWRLMSPRGGL
jgi:hypothetical protein